MEKKILNIIINLRKIDMDFNDENLKKIIEEKKGLKIDYSLKIPEVEVGKIYKSQGDEKIAHVTEGEMTLKIMNGEDIIVFCNMQHEIVLTFLKTITESMTLKLNDNIKAAYSAHASSEVRSILSKTKLPAPVLDIEI